MSSSPEGYSNQALRMEMQGGSRAPLSPVEMDAEQSVAKEWRADQARSQVSSEESDQSKLVWKVSNSGSKPQFPRSLDL